MIKKNLLFMHDEEQILFKLSQKLIRKLKSETNKQQDSQTTLL